MISIPLDPDAYRKHGWWRDRLVVDDLADVAATRPNDTAMVTYSADGGWTEQLTFAQLAEAVDSIAVGLLELGIERGDRVCYQIPNWWYFTAVHLACCRIGAVSCPLVPILRRRELTYMLKALRARVFIVPTTYRRFDHASLARVLSETIDSLEYVFDIDGPSDGNGSFQRQFLGRSGAAVTSALAQRSKPLADDVASIQFTSGTTGEPKGVLHTHNTLFASTRLLPRALNLTADDVVVMPSPLAHASGFLYGVLMPITWGQKVVYQDIWDANRFLEIIDAEGGTYTMGSPPFVLDTIRACKELGRDAGSLRIFSCSGAPIPRYLADLTPEVLGARLANNWGLTETGAATAMPHDSLGRSADSDGAISPAMEVRIVDSAGRELPHGESGRLLIRGASKFVGYFERRDLTDAVVDAEGWLDTGDIASVDDDNYLSVTGRAKDLVIRGGENIPVVEVEAALYQHPDVGEVAIIGIPDARLGERACAVVVPAKGRVPTFEALLEHLERRGFAKQYWPERLELVDALPRTAAGKVRKFVLQQQFSERR
jgi:cyclohexanecarboxylate-CoA ligase